MQAIQRTVRPRSGGSGRGRALEAFRGAGSGRPGRAILLLALLAASGVGELRAGLVDFRFGVVGYQGTFGSDDRNRIVQAPLEVSLAGAKSRWTLRVPYLDIRQTGNVTLGADGPIVLGVGGPGRPSFQTATGGEAHQGLGDITLTDEILLSRGGKGLRPLVAVVLGLKEPTADRKKGLGTGERDWSAGLSYIQPLGKVVQILGDFSYRFMGDPEGIDFKNRPKFGAGLAFVTSHATLRTMFETMRPVLPEVPLFNAAGAPIGVEEVKDRRLVRADLTFRSTAGGTTRVGLTKGLTSTTEEWGAVLIFSTGGQ
jgi:hypothetical protein